MSWSGWGSPGVPDLGARGAPGGKAGQQEGRPCREPEAGPAVRLPRDGRDLGEASQLDGLAGRGEDLAF